MRSTFLLILQFVQLLLPLCLFSPPALCAIGESASETDSKLSNFMKVMSSSSSSFSGVRSLRSVRDVSSTASSTNGFLVEYTLLIANSPDCEPSLVDNFPVRVQYRIVTLMEDDNNGSSAGQWKDLESPTLESDSDCSSTSSDRRGGLVNITMRSYELLFPSSINQTNNGRLGRIQLRFVQSDHRGGYCDCWAVVSFNVTFMPESSEEEVTLNQTCATNGRNFTNISAFLGDFKVNTTSLCTGQNIFADSAALGFCGGSASVPRGFVSVEVGADDGESQCSSEAAVVDSGKKAPMTGDQCDNLPRVQVQFTLKLGGPDANLELNSFDEGVEFSFQNLNGSGEWIPLVFYSTRTNPRGMSNYVGDFLFDETLIKIRGYDVNYIILGKDTSVEVELKVCGEEIERSDGLLNWVRFRWLQTVEQGRAQKRDRVLLDNIQISAHSTQQHMIFSDSFDNETSINPYKWRKVQGVSLSCDDDGQCQLQFGMAAPTFNTVDCCINSRGISTIALNPNPIFQISYTLITANSIDCLNSRSFTGPSPRLEFRYNQNVTWRTLYTGNTSLPRERIFNTYVQVGVISPITQNRQIQFRFVQHEHRGGFCDCWAVTNFTIIHPEEEEAVQISRSACVKSGIEITSVDDYLDILDIPDNNFMADSFSHTSFIGFCQGSASVPRGFVLSYFNTEDFIPMERTTNSNSSSDSRCYGDVNEVVYESKGVPPTNCSDSPSRFEVTFDLDLTPEGCNMPNSFDDGVELSFRLSNDNNQGEWIPLIFYVNTLELAGPTSNRSITDEVDSSNRSSISLRGYTVPFINIHPTNDTIRGEVHICGEDIFNSAVEFRWLQTVQQQVRPENPRGADVFSLDNVDIMSVYGDGSVCELLVDDFDEEMIDYDVWNKKLSYNVHLQNGSIPRCAEDHRATLFFAVNSSDYINSRQIVTLPLTHTTTFSSVQIYFTLLTSDSQDCLNSQLFAASPPLLQYKQGRGDWMTVNTSSASATSTLSNTTTSASFEVYLNNIKGSDYIQFRFVQLEHRGGFCDCWAIANFSVKNERCTTLLNDVCDVTGQYTELNRSTTISELENMSGSFAVVSRFCGGSASIPRGFVTQKVFPNHNVGGVQSCDENSVVVSGKSSPPPGPTNCSSSELKVEVTFDLEFLLSNDDMCSTSAESFHEGVEFSFKSLTENSTSEWIPLMYFAHTSDLNEADGKSSPISIAENVSNPIGNGFFELRGYRVPYIVTNRGQHSISLCRDESVLNHSLQFRWLQTASQVENIISDVVLLDNVTINLREGILSASLIGDAFDNPTSSNENVVLKQENVYLLRNTSFPSNCEPPRGTGNALLFYLKPQTAVGNVRTTIIVSSRELVIGPLDPENVTLGLSNVMESDAMESDRESEARSNINRDERLAKIFELIAHSPDLALDRLAVLLEPNPNPTDNDSDVDLVSATYLLSAISNVLGDNPVEPGVSEAFLSVADGLLGTSQRNVQRGTKLVQDSAGSTLLQVMDRFALRNHNASHPLTSTNIVFHVEETEVSESTEGISPIERENAQINVPREVLSGVRRGEMVRMASLLFRNMSGILPERLNNSAANNSDERVLRLASPVISASFQCENCTTSNLSTPVQVTFKHLPYDQTLLENDQEGSEIMCVFWDFDDIQRPGAVLFQGQWSDDGCYVNTTVSTSAQTVCECNHLTNFAILLSARPPSFTKPQTLALQAFGYIGVSVSLVAMAITVFIFLYLKPLRTMRNYIHIQLCITLGIAQIIFVAGIQPNLGEGHYVGGVPVGCRLVAVLLHYWFLVSFMWMLMEGVVLYVALVRVFVKYHARYIAAFTIASYGLPLLYVGGLTVPLGFARSEDIRKYQTYDYGYEQACYLSPARSFIWSFIAPVIVIILSNFGFFIMAIVIMYSHQKKQVSKDKAKTIRHWMKASISLTVVMGLTWIIGILVIEVEELFVLAFIFTIFVAFQGLFIFVIFVLLSKQVRENYAKWWKAKVSESDFLSKHFGEKSFTTSLTSQYTRTYKKSIALGSSEAAVEKEEPRKATQSEVIKNSYVEEGPLLDENPSEEQEYGNVFTVTFIPNSSLTISNPTTDGADSTAEEQAAKGLSSNNVEEMELNEKRAVPNHYVDHKELIQQLRGDEIHTDKL